VWTGWRSEGRVRELGWVEKWCGLDGEGGAGTRLDGQNR